MARLLYVLTHSTEAPERATVGVRAALAAAEAGHDVALWLTGEGVRLGVKGVAETLKEPGEPSVARALESLAQRGASLLCPRPCFEERMFAPKAMRAGAVLVEPARLAEEVAGGRVPVPT